MFLRLRQLCLVAHDITTVLEDLEAVFGISVCRRNPELARFGVENAVMPFGTSFLEVVAPLQEDSSAYRYLQRRHGDGGYMVILDCDDPDYWAGHVETLGVRIATHLETENYRGLQLHPQDTGGALLEINWTRGGEELGGAYGPGGPSWKENMNTEIADAVVAAELQSADPERLAQRWAEILQKKVDGAGDEFRIALDGTSLDFVTAGDGRGEGLSGIKVRVSSRERVCERARRRGLELVGDSVTVGGVRFDLMESGR